MPVRALRHSTILIARFTVRRSESSNARQGIKTFRSSENLSVSSRESESSNARQGIKTVLGFPMLFWGLVRIIECPSGH